MSITIKNLHSELPEDQLHEGKGFTTASNNTYLKKNHEGSSEWLSESWLQPVKGVVTGSSAPPSESSGDRYILTGSSFHANWDSPSQYEIVEFNGTSWIGIAAVDGMRVADLSDDSVYYFNTAWVQSGDTDTTYTAGDGLDLTSTTFSIDAKANGGLVIESTELAVDLGASSITGTLAVSDGGTGASTLTANGVLIGNGTSAITAVDMSTKGHILIGDGSGNPSMLAIGDDDQVLTADSSEATGVKWAAASGGGGGSGLTNFIETATQNFGVGDGCLDSLSSGGNYNTGVGYNAGTAVTTGDQNIAIGWNAAQTLSTGNYNTIIGDQTLTHASSAAVTGNVIIGTIAGNKVTNSNNTYVGYGSGKGSTGGNGAQHNVGVGYFTLEDCTSQGWNAAVGSAAGRNVTSGQQNTIIGGYICGQNVTTGIGNTIIGSRCEIDGDVNYQTALGYLSDTTGIYGIAIGYDVTAGTNDCVIGKNGNTITCDFDTDGTWTQSSDERKKNIIGEDTLGLDFINDLTPKTYNWKPAEEHPEEWKHYTLDESGEKVYTEMNTDIVMHGLIAQEVKTALDAAGVDTFGGWSEDANGQQQISKSMFVIPLIKAVKELTARLEALENA